MMDRLSSIGFKLIYFKLQTCFLVDEFQGATSVNKFLALAQGTLLTDCTCDAITWREKQNVEGFRNLLHIVTVIGGSFIFKYAMTFL